MKFIYDETEDREECVALIHPSGYLIIKLDVPTKEEYCQAVGSSEADHEEWWWLWFEEAKKKFYPGDKVTIEF